MHGFADYSGMAHLPCTSRQQRFSVFCSGFALKRACPKKHVVNSTAGHPAPRTLGYELQVLAPCLTDFADGRTDACAGRPLLKRTNTNQRKRAHRYTLRST